MLLAKFSAGIIMHVILGGGVLDVKINYICILCSETYRALRPFCI